MSKKNGGDKIYIAVDDEDTFVGDATEVAWSISATIQPSDLPLNTSYYFINKELVSKKDHKGDYTYFHNDHLGSTTVITDENGTLVETTKYDPWGKVLSGGTKSKFLYTGQEKDSETALNYYNARYYDSEIRRFTHKYH